MLEEVGEGGGGENIWNVNSERWWLSKKTSSSSVPTKLKIQEYSTLLCFDRIQVFWNVMLCQWMSGSWWFAGLWCLHFQGSSRPRRIVVFLGLLTLKTKASQSFSTLGTTYSLTQQHSCTFWKTSVFSIATVRTWNLTQLHLYHTTQCLIPHCSSLHCHFVSWGTVFGPYVRNWNTADISLGICCCRVLYSAVRLML